MWFSMNKDILLHNHCAGLKIRTVYHRSNSVAIAQRQILSIFPMILFITSFFSFFLLTQASNQGHELHSASCLLNLLQAGPLDPGFLEDVPGWSSCEVRLSLRIFGRNAAAVPSSVHRIGRRMSVCPAIGDVNFDPL